MENKELRLKKRYRLGICPWWWPVGICGWLIVAAFLARDWKIDGEMLAACSFLFLLALNVCGVAIAGIRAVMDRENRLLWIRQVSYFSLTIFVFLGLLNMIYGGCRIRRNPRAMLISCQSNMKHIRNALVCYAIDYDGFLPPENGAAGLNYLIEGKYLDNRSIYVCPGRSGPAGEFQELTEENCDYIYYGGGEQSYDRKGILLMDKPGNHPEQKYNILYYNGEIESRGGW